MKKILFSILLLIIPTIVFAKTLYVNGSTGNDSTTYANNSSGTPWLTLGRAVWGNASRSSPNSSEAAQAGDTVIVATGTYTTSETTGIRYLPIYNSTNAGTSGNYITYECETNGDCELRATTGGAGQPLIGSYQKDYIKWMGFYINETYLNVGTDTGLAAIWDAEYVELHNNNLQAQYMSSGPGNNHSCIRIESSQNLLIKNNELHGSTGVNGANDSAITIYDSGNIIIEHNEVHSNTSGIFLKHPIDDGPPVVAQGDITIRYNLLYSNTGHSIFVRRAIGGDIYQNVIKDSYAGITWWGYDDPSPQDYKIVNNTIHNCTYGIFLAPTTTGDFGTDNYTYNNIVVDTSYMLYTEDSFDDDPPYFEHNLYYNYSTQFARIDYTNYSFSSWQSTFSRDSTSPVSLTSDPVFVDEAGDNFRLDTGSPCIDYGVDILDLDGDSSTSDAITIGAYITGEEEIGIETGGGESQIPSIQGITIK